MSLANGSVLDPGVRIATVVTQHRSTMQRATMALVAAGLEVHALPSMGGLAAEHAGRAALVLLDLDVAPDVPVAELAAQVRAAYPGVPILVVGAQDQRVRLLDVLALPGIDHMVPKRAPQGGLPHGPDEHAVFTAARRILGDAPDPELAGYLTRGAPLHRELLKCSEQRARAISRLSDSMSELQISEARRISIELAAEELLMNALYDAPCDDVGAPRHAHLDRQVPIDLDPGEEVALTWGCDGTNFGISVSDPFGALEKHHVMSRLRLAAAGTLAPVAGTGGAGLGMAMVYRVVNQLVFTVTPRRRTEVIAVLRVAGSHRENMETGTALHFHTVGVVGENGGRRA